MKKIGSVSGEPASPGLASNGKPLRIRLIKCPLERITEIKQNSKAARGFSLEAKSNKMMSMTNAPSGRRITPKGNLISSPWGERSWAESHLQLQEI